MHSTGTDIAKVDFINLTSANREKATKIAYSMPFSTESQFLLLSAMSEKGFMQQNLSGRYVIVYVEIFFCNIADRKQKLKPRSRSTFT
jgi:hypothetical protein